MLVAASVQDYINPIKFWWQWLGILVLLAGWVIGGAYLLRRNLKAQPKLVKRKLPWYCLAMFLAGLAAGAVGGVIVFMFRAISTAVESPAFLIVGAALGLIVAVAAVYLVIYAMAELPLPVVIKAGTLPLGANVILGIVVIIICIWPVRSIRAFEGHRAACQKNMLLISQELSAVEASRNKLPASLDQLRSSDKLQPDNIRCPNIGKDKPSYFYMPVPAPKKSPISRPAIKAQPEAPSPVRLCDMQANHDGQGRNVMFTSGSVEWLTETEFQTLMRQPENAEFAAALAATAAGRPIPAPAPQPATLPAKNRK